MRLPFTWSWRRAPDAAHKRLSAPLFDTERWVRSFEDGLQQMDQWVNGTFNVRRFDIECQDFGQSPSCLQKLFEFETYGALLDAQPDSNHWVASSNPHGYAFGVFQQTRYQVAEMLCGQHIHSSCQTAHTSLKFC